MHPLPKRFFTRVAFALACLGVLPAARAHVVLAEPTAVAGNYYKATLRVSHGCDGEATTALVVQLPAGLQGGRPQPKTGWRVTTRKAKLAQPYDNHGKTVTEEVVEIRWEAASAEAHLPDGQFDEFAFLTRLPAQPGPLWIKVWQQCEKSHHDWSQVPPEGVSTRGLKSPAALLDVQPALPQHSHHH